MSPEVPRTRTTRPGRAHASDQHVDHSRHPDHAEQQSAERLASLARSVLACPADVDLLVDGVATVLDEDSARLGVRDVNGSPVFACRVESDLARAAAAGRSALVTLASGLGAPGSPERADALVLAGRLEVLGEERCECCDEAQTVVGVRLNFALLTHHGDAQRTEQQHRVPLEQLRSPVHALNQGFLQRTAEHANGPHQDELRRTVAQASDTRMGDVVAVRLTALSPRGVVVAWVDTEGAHQREIDFSRPARTPSELGELLRRELPAGLG